MTRCTDVKFADDLTSNPYSLILTNDVDRNFYFKADTSDEIRWYVDKIDDVTWVSLCNNVFGFIFHSIGRRTQFLCRSSSPMMIIQFL